MKNLIAFLSFFFAAFGLYSQTYQVIKVAGAITNCESGDTLRVEDKVTASDLLCFRNTDEEFAVAAIIDLESRARFMMKAESDETGIQKGRVEDCLIQSRSLTGTRKGKINTLFDMRTFLGKGDFLILGEELNIEVNSSSLAMNADSFFFASYTYKGETINKKLEPRGNLLVLNAKELYRVDNVPISSEDASAISLYYYRPKLKKKELVTTFQPAFLFSTEIEKELSVIIQSMKEGNTETMKKALTGYLIEVYGKADEDNLNKWLDDYLGENFHR